MITKIGQTCVKKASAIGALTGAVRASTLTPEQREALIQHHGLSEDSSLVLRNAGRGVAGAAGGLMLGAGAGTGIGALLGATSYPSRIRAGRALGGFVGGGLGYLAGIRRSTDKYSRRRANEILSRRP